MNRATRRLKAASHWTTIGLFTLTIAAFGALAESSVADQKPRHTVETSACMALLEDFCPGNATLRTASNRTFLIH